MAEKSKKRKTAYIIGGIAIAWLVLMSISYFADKVRYESADKIAIVPVIGEITTSGSSGFPINSQGASSSSVVENLDKAEKDKSVKAIVLEINSPGGTVVASEEIAEKVKASNKPIVAWIREIGTSGAYWIASSADVIVADPLSITGSIGVIGSYLDFDKLFEKYGVTYDQLTTGKYKDIGSPYREMTAEERNLMLSKMYMIHESFVDEVASNRNLPRDKVAGLATGIFYVGKEAKDLGLIDKLGGKQAAINEAKALSGIEKAEEVRFEHKTTLLDVLGQLSNYASYYVGRGIGFELSQKIDQPGLKISAT